MAWRLSGRTTSPSSDPGLAAGPLNFIETNRVITVCCGVPPRPPRPGASSFSLAGAARPTGRAVSKDTPLRPFPARKRHARSRQRPDSPVPNPAAHAAHGLARRGRPVPDGPFVVLRDLPTDTDLGEALLARRDYAAARLSFERAARAARPRPCGGWGMAEEGLGTDPDPAKAGLLPARGGLHNRDAQTRAATCFSARRADAPGSPTTADLARAAQWYPRPGAAATTRPATAWGCACATASAWPTTWTRP